MEQFIWNYAPIILLVIIVLIQFKIFVTPKDLSDEINKKLKERELMSKTDFQAEFQGRRADFEEHIADTYISKETYFHNHEDLKKRFDKSDEKLDDINKKLDRRAEAENELLIKLTELIIKQSKNGRN